MPDTAVFEHKGGYILDDDGKERYLVPDLPGWYFWFEDYGGNYWHLLGPFDTKDEAETHLESM